MTRYADVARQSQDVFVGIAGHDLRTPLQSVSLGAEYLVNSPDSSPGQVQIGARMLRSCRRMGEMLNRILDFTEIRIEGGIPICRIETDLGQVSQQVVDEFRLSRPTATIRSETRGDVSGVWDPGRVSQIYQNLIGNALQHGSPDGEVSVVTAGSAEEVVLTVHNGGEPIPAGEQNHIFDLLRRDAARIRQRSLGRGRLYIICIMRNVATWARHAARTLHRALSRLTEARHGLAAPALLA